MKLLRRVPLLVWIFGVIAAAALVAWPLGGWDTVRVVSKEIPTFEPGEVFHGHRFDVAINGVDLRNTSPQGYDPHDGNIYLIVHTEVTNVWHEAAGAGELDANIVLEDHRLDGDLGVSYALADDGTRGPELNPGMARAVDLVYEVPRTEVGVGDTVTFTLYDSIPREGFVIAGTSWVDLFVAGTAERKVTV